MNSINYSIVEYGIQIKKIHPSSEFYFNKN